MVKAIEAINLFSENAESLANFYKDKVGLNIKDEGEIGDKGEKWFDMDAGTGTNLYISDHSEIKGKNTDPSRIVINLEVDNMDNEVKRLEDAGVKKVNDTYHMEGYGWITTFEDLDGNYFQFVQIRES